jgi:Domain of unknown function (DUF4402)
MKKSSAFKFGIESSMNSGKALIKTCLLLLTMACTGFAATQAFASNLIFMWITNNNTGMTFGSLAAGTGGTVTVSPAGVRTKTGGVVLVTSGAGSAASFTVHGFTLPLNPNHTHTYSITLPANGTVALSGPGPAMAVNNFVSSPPAGGSTGTLAVGTVTQTLDVGATLTVAAGQTPGNYSGTFTITTVFP